MRQGLTFLSLIIAFHLSVGQGLTDEMKATEEELMASNKQINQFFRRFNGEEDVKGNRLYATDKDYRDQSLRKKYLPMLFDSQTGTLKESLVKEFMKDVTDKKGPDHLDFHSSEWFAEVNTIFTYLGKERGITLYMKLQKQGKGYEWIIDDVSFTAFKSLFKKDTSEQKVFIHPMSHELDFMTLRKVLEENKYPEQLTGRDYQPDYLTLFLYELKSGDLTFKTVKNVKFHFFSVPGWYFEVSNFNRSGFNSGWLISNLVQLDRIQKQQLIDYLYDKY